MEVARLLLAATALAVTLTSQAQAASSISPDSAVTMPRERGLRQPSEPPLKAAPDPGAVVVPPKVDPDAIETPPKNIDPEITKPPPATSKKQRNREQDKHKDKHKPQPR
jgi:outer membrane biosynthesis protein TonB